MAAIEFLETLPEETVDELRQAFETFDEDGSGAMDLEEFLKAVRLVVGYKKIELAMIHAPERVCWIGAGFSGEIAD